MKKKNISAILRVGDLDRRITLRNHTYGRDEYGGETETTTTDTEVWAKLSYERGKEEIEGDQQIAYTATIWTIRYRTGIDKKTKIIYSGNTYDIKNIQELGRRRYLKITTELRE